MTLRRFVLLSPAFLTMLVVATLFAPNVHAHARLETSSISPGAILPAAPVSVTLEFSEPVDPAYSTASLIDATGSTVSAVTLALDAENARRVVLTIANQQLPAGSYALVWRVLSATDTHATTGSLAFSAGTGAAPDTASTESAVGAPLSTVAARWLELIALLAIAGALTFTALNSAPVLAQSTFFVALRSLLIAAAVAGLIGAAVSSIAIANTANDRNWRHLPSLDQWLDALRTTDLGKAIVLRTAVFALMLIAALVVQRMPARSALVAATALVVAALASFSLTGHARATSQPALAVAIDLAHLAAAALWGGGIALLGWYLLRSLRSNPEGGASTVIAVADRFSRAALLAMAIIVTSGVVSSAFHVSGPRNLTGERYGTTLIAKVLLVLGVLVIAGMNRLFIVPKLRAAGPSSTPHLSHLRLSAFIEIAFALAILVAAARLTELPPADGPLTVDVAGRQGPIALESTSGDLTIALQGQLDPADGEAITITILDAATHQPATDLARVIVLATAPDPLDPGGAPLRDRFDATAIAGLPGQYEFPRTRLGFQTNWQIEISARRLGVEDSNANFSLDLTGAGAQPPRLVSDRWRWPDLPWTGWLALAAAAGSFAGGLLVIRRLRGLEPVTGAIFLAVVTLISGAFLLSAYRSGPIPTSGAALKNPLAPADSAMIAAADDTFAARCASCHGVDGLGNDRQETHGHTGGTGALTTSQANRLSDGDLYTLISSGAGGTEMPAFDVALTEEQRWQLVMLIRIYQDRAADLP